ncbi:flavin reductase [Alteromonas sp. C1M14]|uniref:flavin reductase n=1 Tax=Alteromonas sp. C1M14 TaxID=2841567 RepID=UPI001C086C4C|nr:flavin reductase [Alteromonas sp. C1M14]MBU2978827.1 flavin reductase [Alteromonas sp. C1M14]
MSLTAINEETTSILPPVTPDTYRQGMASVAAAVNVVTTSGPQGNAGFTATAVCSVSDNPATLLVCLNRGASVHKVFQNSTSLVINTLTSQQQSISNLFGGKASMEDRFNGAQWATSKTGAPMLVGAAVSFDCVITDVKSVATHDVIFCQVVDIQQDENADALLYYQRGYHNASKDV